MHNGVTVGAEDAAGIERLARYLLRPPLSLERMSLDADGSVLYRRKARGRFGGSQTTFDAMDFLARLLMHIPQPKLHTVRYYGEYLSVARARRQDTNEGDVEEGTSHSRRHERSPKWSRSKGRGAIIRDNPLQAARE